MSPHIRAALLGLACLAGAASAQDAPAEAPSSAILTREDAIARALADDPGVDASEAALRAAEAGVRQADRGLNPTVGLLSENLGGTDIYQGLDRAETTLTFAQTLELGGDRAARRALAERGADAAQLGGDIRQLDLIADVEAAFVDAQAAEAALDVAEEHLSADGSLLTAVRRRVEQGRDPSLIADLAAARFAESEIDVESARRTASAARARLASYWGGADDFELETDSFGRLSEAPAADADSSPDLALAEADRLSAQARVELERARAFPDPRLEAGVRQFNQFDDTALIVGVAVPIPIRDNNSGAISRAREDATRAGYEVEAQSRAIARERELHASQRDTAGLEAEALETRVIPQAEEALQSARSGYETGAFTHLDVFEAQRALVDARLRRVSALQSYHRAEIALARLTGARAGLASSEDIDP